MTLSFKPQFKPAILQGTKIHTIREDKPDRWHPGRKIHFATGLRTKNYNQFMEGVCLGTQKIEIIHTNGFVRVVIDDETLGYVWHQEYKDIYPHNSELISLALNDGFDTLEDFFTWFSEDFSGKLIHWTDKKY